MYFLQTTNLKITFSFQHFAYCADKAYFELVGHYAMVTSANDSTHGKNSLHPSGEAWDLRTFVDNDPKKDRLENCTIQAIATRLKKLLGDCYDVVIEPTHIHVEFDPK